MAIQRHRTNLLIHALSLALAAMLPASAFSQPGFDGVVVFGDSLSDPGNLFTLTGQQSTAPFAPIPSAPYAVGGHHFSNGETWVEQLAEALHAPSGAGPAVSATSFTNYAFGGARARSANQIDLAGQVSMHLAATGGAADQQSLYVIWVGTNDVRDALEVLPQNPAAAGLIIQGAVQAIANNTLTLANAGTRTVLIANSPNLALLPAVRALGPDAQAAALWLSVQYNAALDSALNTLKAYAPSLSVAQLDVFSILSNVVAAPELYGLSNAADPCLKFDTIENPICAQANRYLFWDAIHPTRAAHGILAQAALNEL